MTFDAIRWILVFLSPVYVFAMLSGATQLATQNLPDQSAADRVAYTSFRPGNWDVYLFTRGDKSGRRLTSDSNLDYDPSISPDGRWLVFTSERHGNPDLYVLDMRDPAGEPRLLIDSEALEDQAAFAPDGKRIAFVSSASGNAEIYVMAFRPDRITSLSTAENVTRHPGGDLRPAFSPDGRMLAFTSDRDHSVNPIASNIRVRGGDVYVMELGNKRTRRLTNVPGWAGSPAWSADSRLLAYYVAEPRTGGRGDRTTAQVWTMNADGTGQRRVTSDETTALSPEFTSDGRLLYSRRTEQNRWQIVSRKIDGSDARIETDPTSNNYWNPRRGPSAGTFVAHGTGPTTAGAPSGVSTLNIGNGPFLVAGAPFRMNLPDRAIDLYPVRHITAMLNPKKDQVLVTQQLGPGIEPLLSRIDGTEQRNIFQTRATLNPGTSLAWSRDGEWIAFTNGDARSTEASSADIWKMRADGTERQNLTRDSGTNNTHPTFSADDRQIIFRRGVPGDQGVYLMNADGSNVRLLTNDRAEHFFPVFSPVAAQVAFTSNRANPRSNVFEVYVLDFDNQGRQTGLRQITHNDVQEGHLAYSWDGQWLIFSSEQGGLNDESPLVQSFMFAIQDYGEMYAYRLSDGATIRLTHNKWEEGVPSWERALPR
jgi:Tol biopolymer transport system component